MSEFHTAFSNDTHKDPSHTPIYIYIYTPTNLIHDGSQRAKWRLEPWSLKITKSMELAAWQIKTNNRLDLVRQSACTKPSSKQDCRVPRVILSSTRVCYIISTPHIHIQIQTTELAQSIRPLQVTSKSKVLLLHGFIRGDDASCRTPGVPHPCSIAKATADPATYRRTEKANGDG